MSEPSLSPLQRLALLRQQHRESAGAVVDQGPKPDAEAIDAGEVIEAFRDAGGREVSDTRPAITADDLHLDRLLDVSVDDLSLDFEDLDNPPPATDADRESEPDEPAEDEATYIKTGRGGVKKVGGRASIDDLLARVDGLLGDAAGDADGPWKPVVPQTLRDTGLSPEDVERLTLKFLNAKGSASGREISGQLRLPFSIVEPLLADWKADNLLAFRNAAEMGDYVYQITDTGRDRARAHSLESTYFGSAPVDLADYLKGMEAQSIAKQHASEDDLKRAFSDLLVSTSMFEKLGPAVNSGRGMFLFGEPGNGKTSIAERITSCFGSTIYIPRSLIVDGDIIRLFDPGVHEAVDWDDSSTGSTGGLFDVSGIDQRWIRIERPTIVAGGELTMSELEVTQNPQTKVCEAPLQLKSNCGTLVIDDFGRQTMPVEELLNRWIVPLEKRYDFLNLPSGKKIQVPFDQLIVFSTNLEPKDLVDGAFLRRIPYKIEVPDPTPQHFRQLFQIMGPILGLVVDEESVDYLVREHFERVSRPLRACQPRDLLLQVRNYCAYRGLPKKTSREAFDFAVDNYFSVM